MITQKIIARTDSLKLDKIISRYGEDSMRQVVFIIVRPDPESDEFIPITIPEDAVGSFRILKPSGNFVIVPMSKSVLASGETAFDVVLPASANTAKGCGYYDIRITSDTDKYYFTAQGDFLIDDNIISDEVLEDVSEVNGLIFPDDFLTVEDHVAYIDDDTISIDSTWSSDKISEEIEAHAGGDVSKTVSGNPVTFTDGAAAPLVKCVTDIQGYQQGSGTPSPDNIRPIVAYTEGEIEVRGRNLANISAETVGSNQRATVSYSNGGVVVTATGIYGRYGWLLNVPNGTYSLSFFGSADSNAQIKTVYVGSEDGTWSTSSESYIASRIMTSEEIIYSVANINVTNGKLFIGVYVSSTGTSGTVTLKNIMLNAGMSFALYEPYTSTTHTTTYPSAIYRGSEDCVNGEVTSEWGKIIFDGSADENWSMYGSGSPAAYAMQIDLSDMARRTITQTDKFIVANYLQTIPTNKTWGNYDGFISRESQGTKLVTGIKSITTVEAWKTYLANNPLEVCYELATPTTSPVTVTNAPIKSLSGYTHIESSTGDMEVEYITERFQPLIDSIKQL